jgi:NAD(P)-dependent dehydrogenase (short-subunit alcohol dehydrogenase family)
VSAFDLTDKVAIVTGGGTGIGKGIALEFARAGAHVVVASRRMEIIKKAAEEIEALGRQSLSVQTDVIEKEQVDNLVKQTVDKFGRLDILVNNAGGSAAWPFEKISPKGWDIILAINLKGTFLCSQAAGKVMIRQKKGKIVNISSVAGVGSSATIPHYGAAKAGVISLTKTLAVLWGKYNINVNCIAPGLINTPLTQRTAAREPAFANIAKGVPLGRMGETDDIAKAALFLVSDDANYVTGATLPVDGGWLASGYQIA